MADVLAEAVVELEADVDKANKELKAAFKQMDKDAKQAADDIDKSFKQLSGNLGKEFEQAAKEFARQQREQEREAKRVAREIERENLRVQREIERETVRVQREIERETKRVASENAKAQREFEAEAKRVQREIERETERVARENAKAQQEFEKQFIASQRAMEHEARESQQRTAAQFRSHITTLRKLASDRFSLTLGVDTSQLKGALGTATKLGAVLGGLGIGALAGQAAVGGITQVVLAIQELVGAIGLLPAVGAAAGIVIGTLKIGFKGLGDAISADKPEEFAKALETLSDSGKKFVISIRDFKDEFAKLGKAVQNALLADFNKEVDKLSKLLLPVLQKGFVGVAKELNLAGHSLAEFVREGQTVSDVGRVFSNTQSAVSIFRKSLTPLAQAFRDIVAVGSDSLPTIAADLGAVSKRFADFIDQSRESGELGKFFERAIQSVRDLFGVLGNIGSIFNTVMNVAEQTLGGGFLSLLKTATQHVEDFLKSVQGQVALVNFFEGARDAAKVILPILGDVARLILEVVLPAFTKLGTAAAPGLTALVDGLRGGLEKAIPGIVSFVHALSDVVVTLVDAGVLDALGNLVRILGASLGSALRDLAPKLGNLVSSVLTKLAEILPKILPGLSKFAGAFADLVVAALPIVDVLADIVSDVGLPTLQRIAEKLTPIVSKLAESLGDVLLPILPELADAFGEWVDAMAPIADEALVAFVDLLKALVPLLPSIVRSSTELAKALLPIVTLFADLAEVVSKFVTKLYEIPGVKKFMEEELPGLLALLTGTIIVPIGKVLETLSQLTTKLDEAGVFDIFIASLGVLGASLAAAGEGFRILAQVIETVFEVSKNAVRIGVGFILNVITLGFETISNVFTSIWGGIKAAFAFAWEFIKAIASIGVQFLLSIVTAGFSALPSAVQGGLSRLREAVSSGFNYLLDLVRDLPNRIVSALGSLGGLLYGVGQSLVQGFINGIGSMIGAIAGQATTMGKAAVSAAERAINAHSPSREMMNVGEDFGAGFVIGIDNMIRKATQAGAALAAQTVQASTTALAPGDNATYRMNETLNRLTRNGLGPASNSTPNGGTSEVETAPVVVQPEVHVYIGNEEINDHITDVVDTRDRRTKRSLTMGARRIV